MPKYGILIIHDQQGDLGNGMAAEARVYRMVGGNWNNFRRPTEYKKARNLDYSLAGQNAFPVFPALTSRTIFGVLSILSKTFY